MIATAGLHDLSIVGAMSLWGELVEAYHGVHGFGGVTVEFYAHRFGHYSPAFDHLQSHRAQAMLDTAVVLGALLDRFIDVYEAVIVIDGVRYQRGQVPQPFDYRVHVTVTPKDGRVPRGRRSS